jgi:ATP-dependent DNA helicase RecG
MNINEINHLAKAGESSSLEFKTSTGQLSGACETICAFLNTKGGIVLIGVKNNGEVIGQHMTDNIDQLHCSSGLYKPCRLYIPCNL